MDSVSFRAVFWVVLPCKMIVDRRFRGAYCLHHQGWVSRATEGSRVYRCRVTSAPLKRRSTIILHGSTTQKTALNIILAAVRTWISQTQSFVCTMRCETVRFRLQKYRNGGQRWVVNVFSYTIHAQTESSPSCFPLVLSIFSPSYCDVSQALSYFASAIQIKSTHYWNDTSAALWEIGVSQLVLANTQASDAPDSLPTRSRLAPDSLPTRSRLAPDSLPTRSPDRE
jgi:hypothetical protein